MKTMSWSRMSVCLVVPALFLLSNAGFAMIRTLPLHELIGRSELIVIGRVAEKRKVAEAPRGPGGAEETIENIVVPREILKGKWPKGKAMIFRTHQLIRDAKKVWREDELSFPEEGSEVVLFVSRDNHGQFAIVNGIQGLWPLGEDGNPTAMGSRYTMDDLKREIAGAGRGG